MNTDNFIFCEHLTLETLRPYWIGMNVITGKKRLILCPACASAVRGEVLGAIVALSVRPEGDACEAVKESARVRRLCEELGKIAFDPEVNERVRKIAFDALNPLDGITT